MINRDELRQHLEKLSNEDLISILLKRDGKEWQPEALEIVGGILSERGMSSSQKLTCTTGPESTFDETAGLNLITVAEYMSPLDAEADRMILENEGVKAWIFEEDTPPVAGTPKSVQLKVCAEDWKSAMERLASEDTLFPD
jgi:hypothetical protein